MIKMIPEGWVKIKLGDIGKFSTSSVDKKSIEGEEEVCLLNYMDVYNHSTLTEDYPFKKVTAPRKQILSSSVQRGDVFFTPSSETPDDIGHSAVFIGDLENIVHSYHTIRFRCVSNEYLDDHFKSHVFQGVDTYKYFRKRASGSTRLTLSLVDFNELELMFPSIPEQKKIASILTSVDKVIENTQKQIDKLQKLKKATMNKLLTKGIGHSDSKDSELGKIPKSWKITTLENIGDFTKGKGISKKEITSHGMPCIRYAEIYTEYNYVIDKFKSFILTETINTTKKLKTNDIIFTGSGETVEDIGKSIAFVSNHDAYVGGDTIIFSPNIECNSIFLSYQLNDDLRRIQLRKFGQGSSVIHVYTSGVKQLKIGLPPIAEQNKIADSLLSFTKMINTKINKLTQTQSLKKSLMQNLLTGKVRVKVN